MLTLDDESLKSLVKAGAKVNVREMPGAKPSELADLLTEVKRFNSSLVALLNKPEAEPSTMPMLPTPVVHVAAPQVSVNPSVNVQRNYTRFRVTVTKRDANAQMRIQELIIEPIE